MTCAPYLGEREGNHLLDEVTRILSHLQALCEAEPPGKYHVLDLLANAKRRKEEGRFDDAVARLYRAVEAIAQVALQERHGIGSTEKIPLDRIPEPLRSEWASRANDGVVALGLQDAYALLASLNDPLGEKFQRASLNSRKSPLAVRNRSILAHGFERVSERVVDQIWNAALSLADVDESSLPSFPTLSE
jgi:CRISPR-associated protein (TIGR02710 family)